MNKLIYPLLLWIALLSACSSPNQLQSTPSVPVRPSPSMIITSTPKPTFTTTASRPTDTAPPLSPTPIDTIIPSPTAPPAGILAIKFYPPLVLDYLPDQWIDTSEYGNAGFVPNYLQNKVLKTCTIGTRGASGWYPDDMEEIILDTIHYQVLLDQKISPGQVMTVYFAENAPKGSIENEVGIPIFEVKSNTTEAKKCRAAAEEVLATLRRATATR